IILGFNRQRVIRAFAHDVAELVGRDQRLTRLLDLHLAVGVADAGFHVGGSDSQLVIGSRYLQALKDRLGRPGLHDIAGHGDGIKQGPTIADHFHCISLSILKDQPWALSPKGGWVLYSHSYSIDSS